MSCSSLKNYAQKKRPGALTAQPFLAIREHPNAWSLSCAGEQCASSYCVRKGLIRKAHLAHNLKKWAAKHPDGLLAASVPETHVMEVDDVEYIDEALADVYEVHHYPLHFLTMALECETTM